MTTLHVVPAFGEPFDVELTDVEFAVLRTFAEVKGLTVDEAVCHVVADFMSTHPLLEQTRSVQ